MRQELVNEMLKKKTVPPDFTKDINDIKFRLQEMDDIIDGGIVTRNIKESRNTYCVNYQESMTSASPLYIYFHIIEQTSKLIYTKVNMKIITGTPNLTFYVSENDGETYSTIFGPYSTSQSLIDITSKITSNGDKLIKLETDTNTLVDFQVIVHLDIVL
jgi:hypothetical protein